MLKTTHNAGFFSCCNIKLCDILNYFNTNMSLPTYVDSSSQFVIYKPHRLQHTDVTSHFFITDNADSIEFIKPVITTNDNKDDQFSNYKLLNLNAITPFIKKYFTPAQEIIDIKHMLISKYNINTANCVAVYYRGTDKCRETTLGDFSKFYEKIESLNDGKMQLLIQTDTLGFLGYVKSKCLNAIVVDENKVSNTNVGIHNENSHCTNYNDIKYLFATFLIMSECKHLIMSSGNCSLWMMYYRMNVDNVHQCLDNLFIS
jgi:hypothetical protein